MRYLLFILIIWRCGTCCAQENSVMIQGASQQQHYYTTLTYTQVREKIIIETQIGSKKCRFIVDTGAPTMITPALYQELGLQAMEKLPVQDGNSKVDSLTVAILPEISLGEVTFTGIPVLVAQDPFLFDCHGVDGFIGSNLLCNSIVRFSPNDAQMILTDRVDMLQLDKKLAMPMILNKAQRSPYVNVRVKGVKSASITLLFDLGMEGMFDLALDHYAALQPKRIFIPKRQARGSSTLGLYGRGADTLHHRVLLPQLLINKSTFTNVPVETTAAKQSRLGAGLLAYGTVTLDYKNRQFYFEPFQPANDLSAKQFPLAITLADGKAIIGMLWDEKLRDKLDLYDQILAIDGKDISNIDPCTMLTGKRLLADKQSVQLKIRKADGKIVELQIERE